MAGCKVSRMGFFGPKNEKFGFFQHKLGYFRPRNLVILSHNRRKPSRIATLCISQCCVFESAVCRFYFRILGMLWHGTCPSFLYSHEHYRGLLSALITMMITENLDLAGSGQMNEFLLSFSPKLQFSHGSIQLLLYWTLCVYISSHEIQVVTLHYILV